MMTEAQLRLLATPEFNAILAADPELNYLASLKYDEIAEKRILLELLGLCDYRIGKLPVRPLTVAKWAFLWMFGSPLVTDAAMTAEDFDFVLYVLSALDLRELNTQLTELSVCSKGYHLAPQLPANELQQELKSLVRTAFLPLTLLPEESSKGSSCRYDAHWASRVCAIAAAESGKSFDECLHEMPLSSICLFFVAHVRRESLKPETICHRLPPEIENLIDRRTEKLAEDFLKERDHDADRMQTDP